MMPSAYPHPQHVFKSNPVTILYLYLVHVQPYVPVQLRYPVWDLFLKRLKTEAACCQLLPRPNQNTRPRYSLL